MVCEFLFSLIIYLLVDLLRVLFLMMNLCGLMIVCKVFGKFCIMFDGKIVDFGWIVEVVIFIVFGRIFDL